MAEQENTRKAAELKEYIRRAHELMAKGQPGGASRLMKNAPDHVRESSAMTRLFDEATRAEKDAAWEALSTQEGAVYDEVKNKRAVRRVADAKRKTRR